MVDHGTDGWSKPDAVLATKGEETMSLNVYFKDAVRQLDDFTSKPYGDDSGNRMKVLDISLFDDKGRLYTMLRDENSVLPDKLKDCIDGFSFYKSIPAVAVRETGIYRYQSVEAELEVDQDSKRRSYVVKITGKKLEDVRDLLRMIKVGSIRPDESYEGRQLGMSRVEFEERLQLVTADRDELSEQLQLASATCHAFRCLTGELLNESWPLCTKSGVAERIDKILDSASS